MNAYDQLILKSPTALLYAQRAELHELMKNDNNMESDCKTAIRINSECAKANHLLGKYYFKKNKLSKAIKYLQKAQALDYCEQSASMLSKINDEKLEKEVIEDIPEITTDNVYQKMPSNFQEQMPSNFQEQMPSIDQIMNNPNIANLAQQMMQNPEMMNNMMSMLGKIPRG